MVYITCIIEILPLYSNKPGLSHKNNPPKNYVLTAHGKEDYGANHGGHIWQGKS
jgi:hypothetical protein